MYLDYESFKLLCFFYTPNPICSLCKLLFICCFLMNFVWCMFCHFSEKDVFVGLVHWCPRLLGIVEEIWKTSFLRLIFWCLYLLLHHRPFLNFKLLREKKIFLATDKIHYYFRGLAVSPLLSSGVSKIA